MAMVQCNSTFISTVVYYIIKIYYKYMNTNIYHLYSKKFCFPGGRPIIYKHTSYYIPAISYYTMPSNRSRDPDDII